MVGEKDEIYKKYYDIKIYSNYVDMLMKCFLKEIVKEFVK